MNKKITMTPKDYAFPLPEYTRQSCLFFLHILFVPSLWNLLHLFSQSLKMQLIYYFFCGALPVSSPISSISVECVPFSMLPCTLYILALERLSQCIVQLTCYVHRFCIPEFSGSGGYITCRYRRLTVSFYLRVLSTCGLWCPQWVLESILCRY